MARQIAETIREAGFKVWDPLEDVSMGDNWAIEIGKALAGSAAMVLLVSPDAVRSGNLNLELGFALEAEQFANRVIPVLVKETPDAPWILKKFQYVPWGPRAAEAIVQRLEGMHDAKA
ncbi:MAG: toll/interleukin-1 receptor domain-containing protein [Planctomycetaceae bacterium]|nr:toll/interleukin-1 receptor domain-containing protein [Planctomycetaceae bacterium]